MDSVIVLLIAYLVLYFCVEYAREKSDAAESFGVWDTVLACVIIANCAVIGFFCDEYRFSPLTGWQGTAVTVLYYSYWLVNGIYDEDGFRRRDYWGNPSRPRAS